MGPCYSQSKPHNAFDSRTISCKQSLQQGTRDETPKRENFINNDQNGTAKSQNCKAQADINTVALDFVIKDKMTIYKEKLARNMEIEERSNKKLKWDSFTIDWKVGKGSFADVLKGVVKDGPLKGQAYAIKRISKVFIQRKKLHDCIILERKIMAESCCRFITSLKAQFEDSSFHYFVMQLADGDAYSIVRPNTERAALFKATGQAGIRFILACVILAIQYLHTRNIIYRDLKTENILIFADGYVKLTDFGLSKQHRQGQNCTSKAGTPLYYSPQIVTGDPCGKEVDLWALGVIAYELTNLYMPFKLAEINDKKVFPHIVREGERSRKWEAGVSEQLKDFVNRLLKFDPKARLGAKNLRELKSHRLFTKCSFNWRSLEQKTMVSPLLPVLSCKQQFQPFIQRQIVPQKCTPSRVKMSQDDDLGFTHENLFN